MRALVVAGLTAASIGVLPPGLAWARLPRPATAPQAHRPGASSPEAECLEVLDALTVLLRAGTPTLQALGLATRPVRESGSDTSAGWRQLWQTAVQGGDVTRMWFELGQRWECPAFGDVAAAWGMAMRHGCPIAEAMDAAASGVRAGRRYRAGVETAVAGARATMTVLVLLPVLGVALGVLLGVDMLGVYTGAAGFLTLWPGLVLLWVGRRWAGSIVTKALHPCPDARPT